MARTAAQHVFQIPELLEHVLQNLDLRDLLFSQRVSKAFRHAVEGSVRLRRKLFFAPDWESQSRKISVGDEKQRRRPENNRTLLRAFPSSYPSLTLIIGNGAEAENAEPERWSWDVCIAFPSEKPPASRPAVDYPEASWRRMFLSQPPCQALYLSRRWKKSQQPAMVRDDGITMGDFVEEVARQAPGRKDRQWHQGFISSDRDWHFEGRVLCSAVK